MLVRQHNHARSQAKGKGAGKHEYHHWVLRLNAMSLAITHISAGPVIKSDDYQLEGYFKGALIVGSFHVVEEAAGQQVTLQLTTFLSGLYQHALLSFPTVERDCCPDYMLEPCPSC